MTPLDDSNSEGVTLGDGDALILVDMQNDFLPGGSLAVMGGDEIIPLLNACIARFTARGLPVFATRDWHPPDHCSFRENGGQWPVHCVAGTPGAEFAPNLKLPESLTVISKATQPDADAYSGFQDTDLEARLRSQGIERLFTGCLATDYCVKSTVLDALDLGFEVFLLEDAIRAVNLQPDDGDKAIDAMRQKGARLCTLDCIT